MKRLTIMVFYLLFLLSAKTQVNIFALVKANDSLGTNAHSILQYQRTEFVVTDDNHAIKKVKTIVTALDKQGEDELRFVASSSSYEKLDEVTITTFTKLGLPEKVYHKKDVTQHAEWQNFVSEGMYYYMTFKSDEYPATIQYEYTTRHKGIIIYPSLQVQLPGQAIRYSELVITVPKQFDLRYKNLLTEISPVKTEDKTNYTYKWTVSNTPALASEEQIGGLRGKFPEVLVAPNKVKLDDYASDFTSWNDFGRWTGEINRGMAKLTEPQKEDIRRLVANAHDPKEKAKLLYRYLQDNFRYVSIQLGIGGFKSFPASVTHEKKYGDCKALSTYMKACLDAVDIKSYTALVNAGRNQPPAPYDFPVDVFNHVILCIPFGADTTWLDCTSTTNDFGILGSFTENRNALVITDNGGILTGTPGSNYKQNKLGAKSVVTINEDGSGSVNCTVYTKGEYRDYYLYALYDESADDQKTTIVRAFDLAAPETFDLKLPDDKSAPVIRAEITAGFEKVVSFKAGNKLFIPVSWQKVFTSHIHDSKDRKLDYYFSFPFENTDTTVYKLPAGYIAENLPAAQSYSFKYGQYKNSISYNKETNEVSSVSYINLTQQKIPAADFADMRQFFGKATGNEINKFVIKQAN